MRDIGDRVNRDGVSVVRPGDPVPEVTIASAVCEAIPLVWPGMGARHRSMMLIRLTGGTTETMQHPAEAVYYVISGRGKIHDLSDGTTADLGEGSFVFLRTGTPYRFETAEDIEIVGGPCPPDDSLYVDKEAFRG